jgi:anti-sigma28 factor (negative regulator of flagellin synthesis)
MLNPAAETLLTLLIICPLSWVTGSSGHSGEQGDRSEPELTRDRSKQSNGPSMVLIDNPEQVQEARIEKIAYLKKGIVEGSYSVSAADVARKIVQSTTGPNNARSTRSLLHWLCDGRGVRR